MVMPSHHYHLERKLAVSYVERESSTGPSKEQWLELCKGCLFPLHCASPTVQQPMLGKINQLVFPQ